MKTTRTIQQEIARLEMIYKEYDSKYSNLKYLLTKIDELPVRDIIREKYLPYLKEDSMADIMIWAIEALEDFKWKAQYRHEQYDKMENKWLYEDEEDN